MSNKPKVQIVFASGHDSSSETRTSTSHISTEPSSGSSATYVRRYVTSTGGADAPVAAVNDSSQNCSRRVVSSAPAPTPAPASAPAKAPAHHAPAGPTNKVCEKFEQIKREYKSNKKLWNDPDFPADVKSVYPSTPARKIDWKRPKELCDSPRLFSNGVSRFDVQQGELGDCWVLAAVASLSMNDALFHQVVPQDQDFEDNYCGAFHFRFWKFGDWVDVIVDDRLPVDRKELLFMSSKETDEFWSALLEKAYAKLNGCYENLVGGVQAEAMEDFTGGLCEVMNLTEWKTGANHFDQMIRYVKMSSLMGCSIDATDDEIEESLPNGLIIGHAYSVTDVKSIKVKGVEQQLVRVRNPWGDSSEWNGAWSDGSSEWKSVTDQERKQNGITFDDDGEFWMSYKDFVNNFTKLEVCHLGLASLDDAALTNSKTKKTRWVSTIHQGAWKKNVNAGGCRNLIATFWTNPQFVVEVVDPDEDDDDKAGEILIGLMQKDMRLKHLDFWTIGYSVYKLPANHSGTLDQKFFRVNKMADKSPQYVNQREVVGRHKLEPGKYAIIPTTFQQNEEAEFMMRIFSKKANDVSELDVPNGMTELKTAIVPPAKKCEEELRLEKLREEFNRLSGPLGAINACQLRDILNAALRSEVKNFSGFNTEVCRSMVALMDDDQTGKMSFDEFSVLWKNLQIWKKVFKDHDEDNSGAFDAFELRKALTATGFRVSNKIFSCLANRYSDPDKGTICFEDYILLVTRLRNAFGAFKTHSNKENHDQATFGEEAFLALSLYV